MENHKEEKDFRRVFRTFLDVLLLILEDRFAGEIASPPLNVKKLKTPTKAGSTPSFSFFLAPTQKRSQYSPRKRKALSLGFFFLFFSVFFLRSGQDGGTWV